MIELSPRNKTLLKWVGYPLLALFVFVVALFQTFPYERLQDKLVELVSKKYDISISDIRPTLIPGGIVLSSVALQDCPEDAEQVPSMMFFDEVELDVGLFGLLFGSLNVDLVAETASGSIVGWIESDALDLKKSKRLEVDVTTENVEVGGVPGIREGVGLPVAGRLNAHLRLKIRDQSFKNAEGFLRFQLIGGKIGDGVSKIKPRLPESKRNDPRYKRRLAMYGDGLTVPELSLGAAEAEVKIEKGVGTIERLSAKSPDGELTLEGKIQFADPFKDSTLPGCLRFRLTEELKKREKDFGNIDLILDAKRDEDGFFAFPTKGKLTRLQWSTRKPCKGAESKSDKTPTRPKISTRPRPTTTGKGTATGLPGKKLGDLGTAANLRTSPADWRQLKDGGSGKPSSGGSSDEKRTAGDVGDRSAGDEEEEEDAEGESDGEEGDDDEEEEGEGDEDSDGDSDSEEAAAAADD